MEHLQKTKIAGMPLALYLMCLGLTAACMYAGVIPQKMIPALLVLMVLGEEVVIEEMGVSCCSVTKLCPALCDPIDCSTSAFPVLHSVLKLVQTQVHQVSVAIQPSHPLSPPPPPSLNLT